jgi:hypothetical protein
MLQVIFLLELFKHFKIQERLWNLVCLALRHKKCFGNYF